MRIIKASAICSAVLLLTVAHAVEQNSKVVREPALQAADTSKQETVNLAISGMT